MIEHPPTPPLPATPGRPQTLSVLCILTFIWSGINAVSCLTLAALFDMFQLVAQELREQFEQSGFDLAGLELLRSASPAFFAILGLLFIGSLTGAVLMWRMRKAGFHVYTIAQILMLIAPMYFLKLPGPSMLELIVSALFIILYSTQLKYLR